MKITYNEVDYDDDYAHVNVYVKHDKDPVQGALISGDLYSPESQVAGRTRIGITTDEDGIAHLRVARLQYGVYELRINYLAHDEFESEEDDDERVIRIRGLEDPESDEDEEEESTENVVGISDLPDELIESEDEEEVEEEE